MMHWPKIGSKGYFVLVVKIQRLLPIPQKVFGRILKCLDKLECWKFLVKLKWDLHFSSRIAIMSTNFDDFFAFDKILRL